MSEDDEEEENSQDYEGYRRASEGDLTEEPPSTDTTQGETDEET